MRLVALALVCAALTAGERPHLPLAGFFTDDQLQLMFPPDSTLAIVARKHPHKSTIGPQILDAEAGLLLLDAVGIYFAGFPGFRSTFYPPRDHVCVGFLNELDRGDVARCVYDADGWTFRYASGDYMSSITISPVEVDGSAVAVAQRVADRVFKPRWQVTLKWVGRDQGVDFGVHDNSKTGRIDQQFGVSVAHWRNDLEWFKRGDAVGFVALDEDGDFRRLPIAQPVLTRRWFFGYMDDD